MITVRIDVTKIDKTCLFKGEKGTYLDIVLIETPNGKYGNDFMVKQSISKEDRDAGADAPILGNGKNLVKKQAEPPEPSVNYSENSMLNKQNNFDPGPAQTREQNADELPY